MLKRLLSCVRQYKRDSILAPLFVSMEVVVECFIPLLSAQLINEIESGCGINTILRY